MFYLSVHVNLIMLNFIDFIVCILQKYIEPNEMFLQIIQNKYRHVSLSDKCLLNSLKTCPVEREGLIGQTRNVFFLLS